MKIGVIEGSVRQGRNSSAVTRWVLDHAAGREGVEFDHIDLAEFNLPMVDAPAPPMMLGGVYGHPQVQAFAERMAACDGFIFVTPEYNRSVPGVLKNAIDWLFPELLNKPAVIVGYGSAGGVRAVEHLRNILSNFNMQVPRAQGGVSVFTDVVDGAVTPNERRDAEVDAVINEIVTLAGR